MSEEGRLKLSLERFIEHALPGIDYLAQYPGTIQAQNGQLFDFLPDSAKVPGIQGLAFYAGTPGIQITVDLSMSPRAVLFFAGGDPSGAALSSFGNPGLHALSISASDEVDILAPSVKVGDNASLAAARETDPVASATSMTTWISSVTAYINGIAPGTLVPPTDFGTVSGGSSEVRIG